MDISELTTSDIHEFFRNQLGQDIAELSRIGQGEWSFAYSYRDNSGDKIVQFSCLDSDFKKDRYAVAFDSSDMPVPKIVDIGAAFGAYYAISEKADGRAIDYLNHSEMRRILPSLLKMMDALRLVDLSQTTGYGGWNEVGNASHASWRESLLDITDRPTDRINGWKAKLAASHVGIDVFNELYQELASSVDVCPEERYLIHADLLHYNLLVADNQVTAVIDWGCAKYGDFLYELAWFTFWAPWFPAMEGIDPRQEALSHYAEIGLQVPNFEERMRCYEIHIGLDSIVYSAYKDRWDFVAEVAEHTLKIARF